MHRLPNIAVALMIGIVAVFLFPLSAGPFTATNGPVTAFRATTAALAVLLSITTMVCFSRRLKTNCVPTAVALLSLAVALPVQLHDLRC